MHCEAVPRRRRADRVSDRLYAAYRIIGALTVIGLFCASVYQIVK